MTREASIEPGAAALSELLAAWNAGDPDAAEQVVPAIYSELRAIAGGYLRGERPDHTLQATALVHEAYVRLIENRGIAWRNRAHFVGVAAHVMRRVLVDHGRRHRAAKRGGGAVKLTLIEAADVRADPPTEVTDLDDALSDLEKMDPTKARIVELRFFGGLSIDETAAHLGVSRATVGRHWRLARTWLYRRLKKGREAG